MKKIFAFMLLLLNDFLFITGAAFIACAAYRLHSNIGLLTTGVFFIFYAVLISKKRG
ncbi:phage-related protein [Bacillus velezensis YAU B9601-Y2]|uniref:Phage-related protein n=1 Tax=Bacillus amyloliquefaciens (strain Y2) TaxID=1155777 RepID=I2C876_BACAY|nr:phage-related protein [Bacillus velezensis YAU B9601-Y2]CCG50645.1 hypothetical protein BANAU_2624 [Bacillus velezensis YAU B9601-Y2]